MNTKITKIISSFAMAAVMAVTGITAQAEGTDDHGHISVTDITADWDINDYADNIRESYKMDHPEAAEAIDNIVDDALSSAEFRAAYEKDGCSVFLSVEETIRHTLYPETSPAMYESNSYFSIYSFPYIKQKPGYNDGAAAAVLMALYGCGYYKKSTDQLYDTKHSVLIDEINWDSNKETTIGEVTRVIRKYLGSSETHSVQTKYGSSFSEVLNLLEGSLLRNVTPVIRIPEGSGHYYAVVHSSYSEEDVDSIGIVDPRTAEFKSYTYAEFDALLSPYYYSGIWMSVDVPDNSAQAIAALKSEYPSETSYFTQTKGKCTDHNVYHPENSTTCKEFDGGWQCAGFARYVFNKVKNRLYTSSISEANVMGFGNRMSNPRLDDNDSFDGDYELTAQNVKKYLLGLSAGAYIRVRVVGSTSPYPWHSTAVLETTDDKIKFYDANSDGMETIRIAEWEWNKFASKYRPLFYVD